MGHGFTALGEEVVHRGAVVTTAVGRFRGPDGHEFVRDVVHHPGWVAVVPLHEDGTVTCVRQYRPALGDLLLEVPAGLRDVHGEPTEVTARRELAEEAGLACERLELLATVRNSPGCSDEEGVVYVATGLAEVPNDLQGVEEQHLVVERVRLADVPGMVADGRITDAKTLVGLLLVVARR